MPVRFIRAIRVTDFRSIAAAAATDLGDDPAQGGGPEPTFGFGEPPVGEGAWETSGY